MLRAATIVLVCCATITIFTSLWCCIKTKNVLNREIRSTVDVIVESLNSIELEMQKSVLLPKDVVAVACDYREINAALTHLDNFYKAFYPKSYGLTESRGAAIMQVYSEMSQYTWLMSLDLSSDDGGDSNETIYTLMRDIARSSREVFSERRIANGSLSSEEFSLKELGSLYLELCDAVESLLSDSYDLDIKLIKGTSILKFFEFMDNYMD